MRGHLTAIAILLSALPAAASSIETPDTTVVSGKSITVMTCRACPPLEEQNRRLTYIVPQIAPGTDRTEIRTVYGQRKLVRTEAWLGGSPVNVMSNATDAAIGLAQVEGDRPAAPFDADAAGEAARPVAAHAAARVTMAVDTQMTTAALDGPAVATMAGLSVADRSSRNFDGQSFELRLD